MASVTNYNVNFEKTFPFSGQPFNIVLAASTALSITVPGSSTQQYRAKFSCSSTAEIWVRKNGTAAIPSANSSATTAYQELVPLNECRYVNGGETLSFISAGTPSLSVSLLLVQDNT